MEGISGVMMQGFGETDYGGKGGREKGLLYFVDYIVYIIGYAKKDTKRERRVAVRGARVLITKGGGHRVYRVPGFLSSRPNWVPLPFHPQESTATLPPLWGPRGTHSFAGEGGYPKFRRWDM